MFRRLKATEIDVRVGSSGQGWVTVLLYKNARVDMQILDEEVGPFNWQRKHETRNGTVYCTIGIRDPESGEWVWKEDAGSESNAEAEKGAASDSFKRAGFNWGIGRELYTAPTIFIRTDDADMKNGKFATRFRVHDIGYDDKGNIVYLVIVDQKNKVRYSVGEPPETGDADGFQNFIKKS